MMTHRAIGTLSGLDLVTQRGEKLR